MKLVKTVHPSQLLNIYKLYLKSFPRNERKPFSFILFRQWLNTTEVLSIRNDEGDFLGLVITVVQNNLVLIAYFAISAKNRSTGIGSQAFRLLLERYHNKKVFLEIESTESNTPDFVQRQRRKDFYLKNGMREMPFIVNFFGTDMEILTYSSSITFEEYHSIYKKEFGKIISRKVKFVRNK